MKKRLKAQNGASFFGDPADNPIDNSLNILKAAGASYLGNQTSSSAYFNAIFPNDPEKAKSKSKNSALISGAIGGVGAALSQFGQHRDYMDYQAQIQRQKDDEYYRLPYDRYAYNQGQENPYNAGAYKNGGQVRRMHYQDGGEVNPYDAVDMQQQQDYEEYPEAPQEQVVFDSTDGGYEPEDDFPMTEDGDYDMSKFTPTLGSTPLRFSLQPSDIESTISQIGQHESGGNYGIVNTSGGSQAINATGKYQFVPKYWHKEIAQFQGTAGKSMDETMNVFKNSPQVQEQFMRHVVSKYYLPEVKSLLPLARQYGIDQPGLIKMMHYRGIEDTKRRLQTGDFSVSQKEKTLYNNPDILSYVKGK